MSFLVGLVVGAFVTLVAEIIAIAILKTFGHRNSRGLFMRSIRYFSKKKDKGCSKF